MSKEHATQWMLFLQRSRGTGNSTQLHAAADVQHGTFVCRNRAFGQVQEGRQPENQAKVLSFASDPPRGLTPGVVAVDTDVVADILRRYVGQCTMIETLQRVREALQRDLQATDESYAQLVRENHELRALLQQQAGVARARQSAVTTAVKALLPLLSTNFSEESE